MLESNHLIGFGAGGGPQKEVSFRGARAGTTDWYPSITFPSIPLGDPVGGRVVVVAVTHGTVASSPASSVSIGGVPATTIATILWDSISDFRMLLVYAVVPDGAVADVTVSGNGYNMTGVVAQVYTITGASPTPVDYAAVNEFGVSDPSVSATLSATTTGDLTVGIVFGGNYPTTYWTGLSLDSHDTTAGLCRATASAKVLTSSPTVTVTVGGANWLKGLIAASWR